LWDWLKLISTEEEDVMEQLAEKNDNIRKTVGVLKEMSNDEIERALADARQKAIWDKAAEQDYEINEARRTGIEEGIKKGRKEGREEGREKGKVEDARAMRAKGYPISDIAEITGLSPSKINEL
jgi:predicted transposase/invertase (TIGR01784 family)